MNPAAIFGAQSMTTGAHDADATALELPPSDGASDEDNGGIEVPADDIAIGDSETVGLDVATGLDEDAALADLLDDTDRDTERWTDDSDAASEQVALDTDGADTGTESEDGWTMDNEAAGDAVAFDRSTLEEPEPLGIDDDATGMDDPSADGVQDDADLPPMDDGGETDDASDSLGSERSGESLERDGLLGALDVRLEAEEPAAVKVGGQTWPWLAASRVRRQSLGESPLPGGTVHWVGAASWIVSGRDMARIAADAATGATSISAPGNVHRLLHDPRAPDAFWISTDQGLHRVEGRKSAQTTEIEGPSADPAMTVDANLACTTDATGSRLWAQTRLGTLFSRHEDPSRWSLVDSPRPGRHLCGDGRKSMAYVAEQVAHGQPRCVVVRSLDGGATWSTTEVPALDAALVLRMWVCRDVVVLACDSMTAPVLISVGDEPPTVRLQDLREPVDLVYEDGEVVLYGCVVDLGQVLLVRQPLSPPMRRPSIVQRWPMAQPTIPTSLAAFHDGVNTDLMFTAGPQLERVRIAIQHDESDD